MIDDAALLHYRAVKIHPFPNGNGRWSRMLANVWLRKHGAKPTVWPPSEASYNRERGYPWQRTNHNSTFVPNP